MSKFSNRLQKSMFAILPRFIVRNKKKPSMTRRLLKKGRQRLTLPGFILVPSALTGLTSLFGMGRGDPRRYSHLKTCLPKRFALSGA
jgi:hypothetical protein